MRTVMGAVILTVALAMAGCGESGGAEQGPPDDAVTGNDADSGSDAGSGNDGDSSGASEQQKYPDVRDVSVRPDGPDSYTFEVTISSPYDSPERYADGWRITSVDGDDVFGTHTLTHDHAGEQPFTRTQHGVGIPSGVNQVVVEGRDQQHGFGGATVTVPLPDR